MDRREELKKILEELIRAQAGDINNTMGIEQLSLEIAVDDILSWLSEHYEEKKKTQCDEMSDKPINREGERCPCGGNIGVVDDCWRCLECNSLPKRKDPFEEER
jgi:hypothetical protein